MRTILRFCGISGLALAAVVAAPVSDRADEPLLKAVPAAKASSGNQMR